LISRSRDLGGYLIEQLHNLKRKHPIVGDVRGKGLFSCIELQSKQGSQVPIAGYRDRSRNISQEIMKLSMERGLHIIAKWDYVFIAPPLVINKHEIDESLSILDEVLKCIGDRVD
jgi:taurine---2-oxoglutarate transaminase